jgi:hypothetical protein
MSLLDWNSIVNSRQGITFSSRVQYKFIPSQSSSIKEILPPFPLVKNPDSLIITFDVNLRTQVLSKVRKSKRFENIHNLINKLYEEGMGNKEISNYLNSNNIKTPTGKDYTRQLIGMYFYKSRKIDRRLKHSELKLTNIRFWIYDQF